MPTLSDLATGHWCRVREMRAGYGQPNRDTPGLPDDDHLTACMNISFEEDLELLDAAGFDLYIGNRRIDPQELRIQKVRSANLVEMIDACGDRSVVNTGILVACGVPDDPFLREIDNNNLLKIRTGKLNPVTGKFEKAKDHPKPDIAGVLRDVMEQTRHVDESHCRGEALQPQ